MKSGVVGKRIILLLIITSPVFFWTVFNLDSLVARWLEIPSGVVHRANTIVTQGAFARILDMRRAQVESSGPVFIFSKLVYNKGYIVLNELFGYTAYIKPRFYFQAGDSSPLSPINTNPVPIVLFPFWLYGVITSLRNRDYTILFIWFGSTILAFTVGFRSFAVLVPAIVVSFLFAYRALATIKNYKLRLGIILSSAALGLFETARSIYLFF